jgi:hypothetical protein
VQNFQVERHKPNKGLARCAAKNPSGAILKGPDMPIEFDGGPGPQRGFRQGHFHQQQGSLRMGVAGTEVL